jgi:glycosyltransferase involved in cell wall biosynthesis
MKIYTMVDDWLGHAFHRIDKAYHDWAPGDIEWVDSPEQADIQIVHIVGKGELKNIKNDNYVVIQHCYVTQDIPEDQLRELWESALLVSSFHDLPSYRPEWSFRFYGMPWGAEDSTFFLTGSLETRAKAIVATGYVAGTESLEEIFAACKGSGCKMVHLGKNFGWNQDAYRNYGWITDETLRTIYNAVAYVSGLRRAEGFELAAIEGLFCGARPITYNLPTYRWYSKYAIVIEDSDENDIIANLTYILENGIGLPVRQEEIDSAIKDFSWSNLIPKFWAAIMEAWNGRG